MLKPLPKFPAVALSCAPRCAVRTAKGRQPQTSWALGLAEAHWRAGLCQGCPARPCTASRAAPGRAQLCSLCAWAQPRAALDLPALRGNHSRSCAGDCTLGKPRLTESAGSVLGRDRPSGPTEHCGNSSAACIPTEQACSPKQTQTLTWTLYK